MMQNERQAPPSGAKPGDRKQFGTNLDTKSNLELLDELDEYIQTVGEFELDGQVVHTYLAKLQERAPIEAGDSDAVRARLPLGAEEEDGAAPKKRRSRRVVQLLVAGFAAIFALAVLANVLGYQPLSDALNWLKEVVYVRENPSGPLSLPEGLDGEYRSLRDMLEKNALTVAVPTWIPTDCAYSDAALRLDDEGRIRAMALYSSAEREFRIQITGIGEVDTTTLSEKAGEEQTYFCHGKDYMIIVNNKSAKATWQDGVYTCTISGDLTQEELEHMIYSMK